MSYKQYSAINLAYVGDAVFELLMRDRILSNGDKPVNKLHKEVKSYVNAVSQAKMYKNIEAGLTEEERAVMQRGRNAKSYSSAKNATIMEYRYATGLEALFGYVYLQGNNERVQEIFELCYNTMKEE